MEDEQQLLLVSTAVNIGQSNLTTEQMRTVIADAHNVAAGEIEKLLIAAAEPSADAARRLDDVVDEVHTGEVDVSYQVTVTSEENDEGELEFPDTSPEAIAQNLETAFMDEHGIEAEVETTTVDASAMPGDGTDIVHTHTATSVSGAMADRNTTGPSTEDLVTAAIAEQVDGGEIDLTGNLSDLGEHYQGVVDPLSIGSNPQRPDEQQDEEPEQVDPEPEPRGPKFKTGYPDEVSYLEKYDDIPTPEADSSASLFTIVPTAVAAMLIASL